MKSTIKPINVQSVLNDIIKSMSDNPDVFVTNPGKDFSRTRKLSFETVIRMLIEMGGNSLQKELYDWFEYSDDTASVSAFIQQRSKISSNALELFSKILFSNVMRKHGSKDIVFWLLMVQIYVFLRIQVTLILI